ncbi:sugar phosphate nucleotidyltransferase [Methylobacterium sp. A54F]
MLCGGLGTRLRSVINDVPKPMAPVAGRPFLEILLAQFEAFGVTRVVLSTGHLAHVIENHFGARFRGVDLAYSVETDPLGTGAAARKGAELGDGEILLVCNGDTFVDFDLMAAIDLAQTSDQSVVITMAVQDTARYGRLDVAADGSVTLVGRGVTGPGSISAGVYLTQQAKLLGYARAAPFSMEEFIFDPTQGRSVRSVPTQGRFIDIGLPEDYRLAQSIFAAD